MIGLDGIGANRTGPLPVESICSLFAVCCFLVEIADADLVRRVINLDFRKMICFLESQF